MFVAILIFYMPFSANHQEVNAVAVASKVVNAGAKKVAKEIAKDTAVQMSMNMVMNYKYTPKDKTPKEGYSFICMPRDKTSTGDCSKPMEIKTTLSTSDKQQLETKIETNLDKKIAGGIGATRWGKFLNWFVPIFSVGMGVAVIDYAINGDVSDLFDELAFDSLVEMGLVTGGQVEEGKNPDVLVPSHLLQFNDLTGQDTYGRYRETLKDPTKGYVYYVDDVGQKVPGTGIWYYTSLGKNQASYGLTSRNGDLSFAGNTNTSTLPPNTYKELIVWDSSIGDYKYKTQLINALKTNVVMSKRLYYFDYATNSTISDEAFVPKFDELNMPRTNKEGTPLKVPAPGSLPFTKTDTGEVLYPYTKPDGTTGYKTKTGVEVGEDNVSVGNPVITENPDGSKTIKKQPTVSTPNPSPEEDGKIPPKDDEITEGDLEGMSCTRLKKPDFKPLTNAFTTSFPFSIPWDLQRMFQSAFSEIGSNEPAFEYKFEFNGQVYDWNIKLPDYFDSWTKFVRPLLLIIFDIGLIYAIYRFTKGSD